MRKNMVAGNWKMNLTLDEGFALLSEISNMLKDEFTTRQNVVVCTPFIHLASAVKLCGNVLQVGAQDVSVHDKGAYTGEVSASMLQSAGVRYVITGHSERRKYFNETDAMVLEKMRMALKNNMSPILCVGESLEVRKKGEQNNFVLEQLANSLFLLEEAEAAKVIIAYEPVWAIGTGETASAEQAQDMHAFIRGELAKKFNTGMADNATILYGGSVTAENAAELFTGIDVDGGLIGGASLKSRDFINIIKALK